MKIKSLIFGLLLMATSCFAQNGYIKVDALVLGAKTQSQRLALVAPPLGLMVYQSDGVSGFYTNTSTGWTYSSKGATGEQGIQGLTGAPGSQGIQGLTGATGIQGPQGIQGLAGAVGIQGLKGDTGSQGIQGLPGAAGGNYDVNKFVVSPTYDRVGVGIANPTEKFHVRWGHVLLEGDGVSYQAKNGVGNTYALSTLGNNNVFAIANNLLKLDPQWGSTALSINGGLVASNVPIYINSSGNNFIVKTANGGCRKIVVADDGVITTPVVVCP